MVNISLDGYSKRRRGEPQNTMLEFKSAERTSWTGIIGIYLARDWEYRLTKWKTEERQRMLPFGLARNEKSCSYLLEDTKCDCWWTDMHTEFLKKHCNYALGELEKLIASSDPAFILLSGHRAHSDSHRTDFREISKIFNIICCILRFG
jgi:hypothetical protein